MKYAMTLLALTFSSLCIAKINTDLLVGRWGNSDDGGKTVWGIDVYSKNGMLKSSGMFPGADFKYEVEGVYKIKTKFKTLSCLTITKSSHPDLLPVGEYWCDEIVSLTKTRFVFRDSDGYVTTLYRLES